MSYFSMRNKYPTITRTAADIYDYISQLAKASAANGYVDGGGVYVFASRETIAEKIICSVRTVTRSIKQLIALGLIIVKRMGRGMNNRIYLKRDSLSFPEVTKCPTKRTITPIHKTNGVTPNDSISINHTQEHEEPEKIAIQVTQHEPDQRPEPAPTLKAEEELTQELFLSAEKRHEFESLLQLIKQAIASKHNAKINGAKINGTELSKVYSKLTLSDFEAVINQINEQTQNGNHIRNVKNYVLTALFNQVILKPIVY